MPSRPRQVKIIHPFWPNGSVPVLKKLGVYFNIEKRGAAKALPDYMLRLLSLSKI
jgi:hypothetical protein